MFAGDFWVALITGLFVFAGTLAGGVVNNIISSRQLEDGRRKEKRDFYREAALKIQIPYTKLKEDLNNYDPLRVDRRTSDAVISSCATIEAIVLSLGDPEINAALENLNTRIYEYEDVQQVEDALTSIMKRLGKLIEDAS